MPSTKTDPTVPYSRVLKLLRDLAPLVPDERRRDFQNVVGPFLVEHEQDQNAVALIVRDLIDGKELGPVRIDETPAQRRDRAARNILRHRSAALAIGMDDLPGDLRDAIVRDVARADAALKDWRSGSPEERAARYSQYRADFE